MEFYSAIKRNKIIPGMKNMDEVRSDHIKWSKSDSQRYNCIFSPICKIYFLMKRHDDTFGKMNGTSGKGDGGWEREMKE